MVLTPFSRLNAAKTTFEAIEAAAFVFFQTQDQAAFAVFQSAENSAWAQYVAAMGSIYSALLPYLNNAQAIFDATAAAATAVWRISEAEAWTRYNNNRDPSVPASARMQTAPVASVAPLTEIALANRDPGAFLSLPSVSPRNLAIGGTVTAALTTLAARTQYKQTLTTLKQSWQLAEQIAWTTATQASAPNSLMPDPRRAAPWTPLIDECFTIQLFPLAAALVINQPSNTLPAAPTPPVGLTGREFAQWFEALTPAEQAETMRVPAIRARLLTVVPGMGQPQTVGRGAFYRWFNALTSAELNAILDNPTLRRALMDRLRYPGGQHEWLMVSRVAQLKQWGVTAEQIHALRTATQGGGINNNSTAAHNSLGELTDSSSDFPTFRARLQGWANRWRTFIPRGAAGLPEGLRLPPVAEPPLPPFNPANGPQGPRVIGPNPRVMLGLRAIGWLGLAVTVPRIVEDVGLAAVEEPNEALARQAAQWGLTPNAWRRIQTSQHFRRMAINAFIAEVGRAYSVNDRNAIERIELLHLSSADWVSIQAWSRTQGGGQSQDAGLQALLDHLAVDGSLVERTQRAMYQRALQIIQDARNETSPERIIAAIMTTGRRGANIINDNREFQTGLLRALEDDFNSFHAMVAFLGLPPRLPTGIAPGSGVRPLSPGIDPTTMGSSKPLIGDNPGAVRGLGVPGSPTGRVVSQSMRDAYYELWRGERFWGSAQVGTVESNGVRDLRAIFDNAYNNNQPIDTEAALRVILRVDRYNRGAGAFLERVLRLAVGPTHEELLGRTSLGVDMELPRYLPPASVKGFGQ